jgi:hypothetical protein
MRYQIIEDNGGGLHAFIWDRHGRLKFGIGDLEYLEPEDFLITLADLEYPATKAEDVKEWEGHYTDPRGVYKMLTEGEFGWRLIACNPGGKRVTYPDRMGAAGRRAFAITE